MSPSSPFVDPGTGAIDVGRVVAEAIPVAKLVGLFLAVALVPLSFGYLLGPSPPAALLTLVAQFVLAVGSAVVLVHVVVRGVRLADE